MQVVLLSDIVDLGKEGEVKEVATGYARNYLFPKGLALPATPGARKEWEERQKAQERHQARERQTLEALAQRLEGMTLTIKAKSGAGQRLYGAITSAHIARELSRQGIELDRRKIDIPRPIKEVGSHSVVVKLAPGISPCLQLVVEAS